MGKRVLGASGCAVAVFLFLFWTLFWFIGDIDGAGVVGFVLNGGTIIVVIICAALIKGGLRLIKGQPIDKDD